MPERELQDIDPQPLEELNPGAIPLPVVPKERYDLRILSSIRRIIRSVDIYSRKLIQEHGVTVPQLLCMLKIYELGPLTIKELSEEVYLNPSTIVGIVDRLEKHRLFARERSVKDRRKVRILLTVKGREMVEQSPSPLQDSLARSIEHLPELEKATIALSLEKVLEMMNVQPSGMENVSTHEAAVPVLETASDLQETQGVEPKVKAETEAWSSVCEYLFL